MRLIMFDVDEARLYVNFYRKRGEGVGMQWGWAWVQGMKAVQLCCAVVCGPSMCIEHWV